MKPALYTDIVSHFAQTWLRLTGYDHQIPHTNTLSEFWAEVNGQLQTRSERWSWAHLPECDVRAVYDRIAQFLALMAEV